MADYWKQKDEHMKRKWGNYSDAQGLTPPPPMNGEESDHEDDEPFAQSLNSPKLYQEQMRSRNDYLSRLQSHRSSMNQSGQLKNAG
jgi:hypothetical protein